MDSRQGNFLPLDYYNLDDDDLHPQSTLEKFKDKDSGRIFAASKFFDNHGNFEWKDCEVLEYDTEKDRFKIVWLANDKNKLVSRVNLRFLREEEVDF